MWFKKLLVVACLGVIAIAVFISWRERDVPRPPAMPRAALRRPAAPPNALKRPAPVLEPAKPLAVRPDVVRAVYFTSWSAGIRARINYLVELRNTTDINAAVFDIKDYSGLIAYRTGAQQANQYGAVRVTIRDIDALVNRLHQEGLYAIARITVFQDPILAQARPELAVHRLSKFPEGKPVLSRSTLWLDRKRLAWIDPASRAAWEYTAAIAKDAIAHGFDEINFDYVRFPSDGDLKDMYFPSWDKKTPKHAVIREFFGYLQRELAGTPISADLFGLATVNEDDLGIGQVIEDAYRGFDFVCPMVYPSHFAKKFLGYPNPADRPYEVVNYSMKQALARLEEFEKPQIRPASVVADAKTGKGGTPEPVKPAAKRALRVKLRPWLQDFSLGARYDAAMVKAQIDAVRDALGDRYAGYMLWSPSNVYTKAALQERPGQRAGGSGGR